MLKKVFSIAFGLFYSGFILAQTDFLKDPDIVWATEIEQDWVVDIPPFGLETLEGVRTLKLRSSEIQRIYQKTPRLFQLIGFSVVSGKTKIFKDPKCTQETNWKTQVPDLPVHCLNVENYDEFTGFDCLEYNLEEIKCWRLRQILAYHKRSATWSTHVVSIAPLKVTRNAQGDSIGLTPLFWIKPVDFRPDLGADGIIWAKKTINTQPETQVLAYPANLIKLVDGFRCPLEHVFNVLKSDRKTPFYNAWNEVPLSAQERVNALAPMSIMAVVLDPVTLEDQVVIGRDFIDPLSIQNLQLIQTWYWDAKHGRLSICLDAVAPLFPIWNDELRTNSARTLFYRRAKP